MRKGPCPLNPAIKNSPLTARLGIRTDFARRALRGSHCEQHQAANQQHTVPTLGRQEKTEVHLGRGRTRVRPSRQKQISRGGETVRKGRCPLNPAPPGALAGAVPPGGPGRGLGTVQQRYFAAEHFLEACGEASDAPTDERASEVARGAERNGAVQTHGRRPSSDRAIAY